MTISTFISAIIQLILFSLVPFFWWQLWGRKKEPFFEWLGFKKTVITNKPRFYCFFIVILILFSILGLITLLYFTNDKAGLASSEFYGVGYSGIVAVLIYAFIQTGLSEEILFRGFIGKRLSSKFGFAVGNTVQAVLFGCLHGVMFFSDGILNAAVTTLLTGLIAWFMGFINEKLAGGSIIPSWIMHGLSNLFSAFLMLFSIVRL